MVRRPTGREPRAGAELVRFDVAVPGLPTSADGVGEFDRIIKTLDCEGQGDANWFRPRYSREIG